MGHLEFCKYAILFECHHSKRCIDKKCRSTISHFAEAKWHIRRIRLREMHLPFASAKWQSLWRRHRIRHVKCHCIICHFASAKCIRLWRMRCVCQFAEANWQMAKPLSPYRIGLNSATFF
jgi:hypothetical protein